MKKKSPLVLMKFDIQNTDLVEQKEKERKENFISNFFLFFDLKDCKKKSLKRSRSPDRRERQYREEGKVIIIFLYFIFSFLFSFLN